MDVEQFPVCPGRVLTITFSFQAMLSSELTKLVALLGMLAAAKGFEGLPRFDRKMPLLAVVPVGDDFRLNCSAKNATEYVFKKDGVEKFPRYFGKSVSVFFRTGDLCLDLLPQGT